ncbi:hypothetical protein BBW65_02160 [Helicobacter enhydrae]|uniref:Autotransporter domain-containing protein n=1 Tax=Helicobacter enhydrae TaxID=222136 RepID=A0A1B1U4L7_9HELI|nr:autotransporter outer membrane beta-barrel domain-containing protein [Helicobacter enhydrae]ANV97681.1 hypothetical protein BBW65_02160 [Helicobacter enhydrae]
MANKSLLILISCATLNALTINDWGDIKVGIYEDFNGHFTYDGSDANKDKYILTDNITFISPEATLNIHFTLQNGAEWANKCGLIFCADGKSFTFNPGNIVFDLDSQVQTQPALGVFDLKSKAALEITSNLTITATPASNFDSIFKIDASNLTLDNANLFIDLSQNQNKTLFHTSGASKISINQGGDSASKTIQLTGDITIGGNTEFKLSLSNPRSFYKGIITLNDASTLSFEARNSFAQLDLNQTNPTKESTLLFDSSLLDGKITKKTIARSDLNLINQSAWLMRASSHIRNLHIKQSVIDFTQDSNGSRLQSPYKKKTLEAQTLTGNGDFNLYADVAQKQTDMINLQSANGTHKVHFLYNPATFTQDIIRNITEQDNLIVASIQEADSKAVFEGVKTQIGLLDYETILKKNATGATTDWIIAGIKESGESTLASALLTALNTHARLNTIFAQTLNLRLGDLRNYHKDNGLYFRYNIGQNALQKTTSLLPTQDFFMTFSAGYDFNVVTKPSYNFWGGGLDFVMLQTRNGIYQGDFQSFSGNAYFTSIFANRFYYDLLLRYAYNQGDLHFNGANLNGTSSTSSHTLLASAEIGYKIKLHNDLDFFFLEPQIKLNAGVTFVPTFTTKDTHDEIITAPYHFGFPLFGRSGLNFGYEWNSSFRGDVKAGTYLTYNLKNGFATTLKDTRSQLTKEFSSDFDVGLSLASNLFLEEYLRFYLEFDASFLAIYRNDYLFNAGIRWSFGERYVPPPPPSADPNRLKVHYKYKPNVRNIPIIRDDEVENMYHHQQNIDRIRNQRTFKQSSQGGASGNNQPNGDLRIDTPPKDRSTSRDSYIPSSKENNR